jgi:ornithine cyclodeaminase
VYSTVDDRFTFVVVLFSADDGRRLAVLESDTLTRLRTAATSVLATEALRPSPPRRLVIIGTGSQATGHVEAFAARFDLDEVLLVGRSGRPDLAASLSASTGCLVRSVLAADTKLAVDGADVVVTATRATAPVLDGDWLSPGAHVCAVGSSRPEARELDRRVYERASVIAVEWLRQARSEAGGLVDALADGALAASDVVDLAEVVAGRAEPRRAGDVTVFQSVGIGLEDVAVAAVAWRAAEAAGAGGCVR